MILIFGKKKKKKKTEITITKFSLTNFKVESISFFPCLKSTANQIFCDIQQVVFTDASQLALQPFFRHQTGSVSGLRNTIIERLNVSLDFNLNLSHTTAGDLWHICIKYNDVHRGINVTRSCLLVWDKLLKQCFFSWYTVQYPTSDFISITQKIKSLVGYFTVFHPKASHN